MLSKKQKTKVNFHKKLTSQNTSSFEKHEVDINGLILKRINYSLRMFR